MNTPLKSTGTKRLPVLFFYDNGRKRGFFAGKVGTKRDKKG